MGQRLTHAGIFVDRRCPVPLHTQLATALRDAILTGRLSRGERLPSSRDLQTFLGISRNTVVDAIEQLQSDGFLFTVPGVGTFVAKHIKARLEPMQSSCRPDLVPTPLAEAYIEAAPLVQYLSGGLPLRPCVPALDLFPTTLFRRCFRPEDWMPDQLDYPEPRGYEPLREAIAQRLRLTRGLDCSAEQVFITNGAQRAIWMAATVLLREGDGVIVEDPSYPHVRALLRANGARLLPTPVDKDGMDTNLLASSGARLAYVTPSHQYPTGAMLSLERRFALLEWSERNDAWIIEDDYDSEFNYTGRPQTALHGLGEGRRVLYVGTFSKVLSPALRTGYLIVPLELVHAFSSIQRVTGGAPDILLQSALARFISEGHFGRHITKMRKVYDQRREQVARALTTAGKGAFRIRDSKAGLHFIAEVDSEINDKLLSERARSAGITVPPLTKYFSRKTEERGLVVGFAATPPSATRTAVGALVNALESLLQRV